MRAIGTVLLLVLSNIFMTFAWYGHLKLQEMKVSTSCKVVLCSTAKRTALSVSKKQRIKDRAKVTTILGLPRQSRKLYPAMEKACLIFFIAAATSSRPETQTGSQK